MVSLRSILLTSTVAVSFISVPSVPTVAQGTPEAGTTATPSVVAQATGEMGLMAVSGTIRNIDEDFGEIRVDREDTSGLEVIYVGADEVTTLNEGDMVDLLLSDGEVIAISQSESGMMMMTMSGPVGDPATVPMAMFVPGVVRNVDDDFGTIRVDRADTSGLEVIDISNSDLNLEDGDEVALLVVDEDVVAVVSDGEMVVVDAEGIESETDMMETEMSEPDMMEPDMSETDMTETEMSESTMTETEMETTTTTTTTTPAPAPAPQPAVTEPVRGLW